MRCNWEFLIGNPRQKDFILKWVNNIVMGSAGKMNGFVAFFDVLGFKSLIERNDLDTVINIYDSVFIHVDKIAKAFAGINDPQDVDHNYLVNSFVFSDTIILYQDFTTIPKNFKSSAVNNFILTSSYLLRLAFDRGIPLRGAIGYGDFLIRESPPCFLGHPIVEAFKEEKDQEWSGAALSKSAERFIDNIYNNELNYINFKKMRDYCPNCFGCNFAKKFDPSSIPLIKYPVPTKKTKPDKDKLHRVLRWDDSVFENYIRLGLGTYHGFRDLDRDQVTNLVRAKFCCYKKVVDEKVLPKINNTSEFIIYVNDKLNKEITLANKN